MMENASIVLPRQFDDFRLSQVAAKIVASDSVPPQINFDFSQLTFVRPAGVVFLSNLIHWLHHQGTKVRLVNTSGDTQALRFLDDSLFFEQHAGEKLRASATPRSTTLPLIQIAQQHCHHWLQTNFLPWLANSMSITQASLYPLRVCLSELFNNIKDHTQYDIGSIFVQHFPNVERVVISLSDFGQGIPSKVREKMPKLSDAQAIAQAVQEGFTSKSIPGNQGLGLDYLLRNVVVSNDGVVSICSSNAIVRFFKREGVAKTLVVGGTGFCPGTTIEISLRTNGIDWVPEEPEDLQW